MYYCSLLIAVRSHCFGLNLWTLKLGYLVTTMVRLSIFQHIITAPIAIIVPQIRSIATSTFFVCILVWLFYLFTFGFFSFSISSVLATCSTWSGNYTPGLKKPSSTCEYSGGWSKGWIAKWKGNCTYLHKGPVNKNVSFFGVDCCRGHKFCLTKMGSTG